MAAVVIVLSCLAAGLVQAVTGFGSGIITMLFFPLYYPLVKASALSTAIVLQLSSTLTWRYRKHCQWKIVLQTAFFYLITSSIAVLLSPYLPTLLLKRVFGGFLLCLSVYFLLVEGKFKIKANFISAFICGSLSGVTGGLFGIGGPPMVIYFLAALDDKLAYIASIQLFFLLTGGYTMILRVINGIYTSDLLIYTLIGMLAIHFGKLIGIRIVDRINVEMMRKMVYIVLGISGVLYMIQ